MHENEMMEQVGEKRNMSALEKKIDALLLFCTADTRKARREYHVHLQQLAKLRFSSAYRIRQQIDKALSDLGIPDHLLGYDYLQTAIEITLQNPEAVRCMTTFLYPSVARLHETKPPLVERGMRFAIECGWDRCDLRMQETYFGGKVNPNRSKPTNSEFVARISNIIRSQNP